MPNYIYKVRDAEGKFITGKISYADEEGLRQKLEDMGFFVISIFKEKKNALQEDVVGALIPIGIKEILTLTIQLANTIEAGVPLLTSLQTIVQETKHKKLSQVLEGIIRDLKSGSSLSEALSKYPKVFSPFYVNMVQLGENTGNLPQVLYRLAEYIKRQAEIRRKVISALIYPAIISVVAITLIVFILVKIMPQFIKIFKEENIVLPVQTQILLFLSNLFTRYWYILAGLVAGTFIGFRFLKASPFGRLLIDKAKLHLPLFGKLFSKVYMNRFIEALSVLYNSGLPIMRALRIVEDVIGNLVYSQRIRSFSSHVAKGGDISEFMKMLGFFTPDVLMMVKAGEESGTLGQSLEKVAQIYREEIDETIERTLSMFEPLLILVMGGIVGFMVTAILFPIFKLTQALSGG